MRNIKELLTVMLENEWLFSRGLCTWVNNLLIREYINGDEYDILRGYVRDNAPFLVKLKLRFYRDGFWWEPGNIKPRIRWIKKHIKKNENRSKKLF